MSLVGKVKKTLLYGQFFGYHQNLGEVHHWLVSSKKTNISAIPKKLIPSLTTEQIRQKKERAKNSKQKIEITKRLTKSLSYFPFIWFVGITGSVAANNAKKNDDLDIFIVTAPSTLWIIRPFVLLFFSLKGVRRGVYSSPHQVKDLICPNLWLDFSSLELQEKKRSLYTAHEVLQVYPIINKKNAYPTFIHQNSWTKKYLANAYQSCIGEFSRNSVIAKHEVLWQSIPFYVLLAPLNFFFFLLQFLIMLPHKKKEEVSLGRAFFHDTNYSTKVLKRLKN